MPKPISEFLSIATFLTPPTITTTTTIVRDEMKEKGRISSDDLLFVIFSILSIVTGVTYIIKTEAIDLVAFILSVAFMIVSLLLACYKSIMKKLEEMK